MRGKTQKEMERKKENRLDYERLQKESLSNAMAIEDLEKDRL